MARLIPTTLPPGTSKGTLLPGGSTPVIPPGQLQPQSGGTGPATSQQGQSDWTNLLIRVAEFSVGAILIWIGLAGLVARTRPVKMTVNAVAGGVAGGAAATVRQRTRTQLAPSRRPASSGNGNGNRNSRSSGTLADRRGTSPEFRQEFLGGNGG